MVNDFTIIEEDALALTQAAVGMSRAREENDDTALISALDDNLKLWVGIKTVVAKDDCPLPQDIKNNLRRLSEFTVQKTFELGRKINDQTLETLINTNLQISEGLLEACGNKDNK